MENKQPSYTVGDLGSIPGLGRSPGEGKSYTLQYPGLENCIDCIVQGVAKSWTRLSDLLHSLGTEGLFSVVRPGHKGHSPNCKPPNYNEVFLNTYLAVLVLVAAHWIFSSDTQTLSCSMWDLIP